MEEKHGVPVEDEQWLVTFEEVFVTYLLTVVHKLTCVDTSPLVCLR